MLARLRSRWWWPYLALFLGALVFRLATALAFRQPGYTDAYYYSNVAEALWQGRGLREDYIWNYLAKPLPDNVLNNPSNLYWMPLTSLLIYPVYLLAGGSYFLASQIPNILLSSALSPLTFYLAQDVFRDAPQRGRQIGWRGGILVIFCSIYAPYFVLPDNFAPFAFLSFGFLICTYKALRLSHDESGRGRRWLVLAGVSGGLAYLTRVDGLLLPVAAGLVWLVWRVGLRRASGLDLVGLVLMGLAFGLTVAPWLGRNLAISGQVLPGGGIKTLFWREYNDFFSYLKPLDLPYYLNQTDPSPAWGIGPLLGSKLSALLENTAIIWRGALFLLPFFVLGLCARLRPGFITEPLTQNPIDKPAEGRFWQRPEILPFVVYTVLLYLAMSLVFTFPSTRGSVFHSSGGLLPFIYLVSLVGLESFLNWLGRFSRPKAGPSRWRNYSRVFLIAFALIAVGLTMTLRSNFDQDYRENRAVGDWLAANEPGNALIMVPDAPAYWYANHRPSLAITSDPLPTNLELARRYKVGYFMVQPNHGGLESLTALYKNKAAPGFQLAATLGEVQLYHLEYNN